MRESLKRSFIQRYTVQGEMRDELFRNISHSRKRVFLEVRPLNAFVCVCARARVCVMPLKAGERDAERECE